MNILTFDTSLDKTYVTLSCSGSLLECEVIENHNEKYHSAFLIPAIVSILKKHNMSMQNIDAIGTNVGPGSFTGIRACVTVARVIAQQLNVPLVGVSSLEILSKINKSDKNTILVLDARKSQYYTAVYSADGDELQPPKLTMAEDVLSLDFSNAVVIADETSAGYLKENSIDAEIYTQLNENLGIFLNKIVEQKLKNSQKDEFLWAKLKPLYLQAPPVTISAKSQSANLS